MKISVTDCPLCLDHNTQEYSRDKFRSYFQCTHCELIFVPRSQLISPADEHARYQHHENAADDVYYQKYLQQIRDQILPTLKPSQRGLDFGCGGTELLGELFQSKNFEVDSYDLYFFPREEIWNKKYHFIILSEVIEHLRDPLTEMQKLTQLLLPQGKIFIKTKLHPGDKSLFDNWFYKRDNTHVQFFNQTSLKELAKQLKMEGPIMLGEDLSQFTGS